MAVRDTDTFFPPMCLRGMYAQTVLASSRIRSVGRSSMLAASREIILDAGEGVRLQGFYSPQLHRISRGLVILMHGWEGSASSTYVVHTGTCLYQYGYEVFRLNFRDHGETHHLNEGLFYGTLLEEVFQSVIQASELTPSSRIYIVGFSLGGNFALRVARRSMEDPTENLKHVMAISPVLDPGRATDAIDNNWLLRRYFLKKWRRSLKINQRLYPHLYDFSGMLSLNSLRLITDALVNHFGIYPDTQTYFKGYTIKDNFLNDVAVPTTVVISRDDPAIPVDDFYNLKLNVNTELIIHGYGGHNGFIYGLFSPTWYERKMIEVFDNTELASDE